MKITLLFTDIIIFNKWLKKLQKFTIQRNPKSVLKFNKLIGTGVTSEVYLASEKDL
jgi:hypothetical protein